MIEKGKLGGTCLNVGCIPAKELLETAATFLHVKEAGDYGITAGEPGIDWAHLARPQGHDRRPASSSGLGTLLKSRKVTVLDGHGRLARRQDGHRLRRRVGRPRAHRRRRRAGARARCPARCPGFEVDGTVVMTSDEFLSIAELPEVGRDHRRRRDRLRVRLAAGRPRHPGHHPRGAAARSCPASTRTSPRSSSGRSRAAASTIRTGVHGRGPHARRPPAPPCSVGRRAARRRRRRRVGRPQAQHRRPRPRRHRRGRHRPRLHRGRRGLPHRRARRLGRRRRHRHPGAGPHRLHRGRSSRSRTSSARTRRRSTTPRCRGPSTAGPRRPSPGCPRRRPRRPASTSSPRRAASTTTGGRMIVNQPEGMVKVIAEKDADGTAGRILGVHMVGPVGHRAARPGLPRRQLGGHRRRHGRPSSSPTPR